MMGEIMLPKSGGGGLDIGNCIKADSVKWANSQVTMTFDISSIDLAKNPDGIAFNSICLFSGVDIPLANFGGTKPTDMAYTTVFGFYYKDGRFESSPSGVGIGQAMVAGYVTRLAAGTSSNGTTTVTASADKKKLTIVQPMDIYNMWAESGYTPPDNVLRSILIYS